MGSGLDDGAKVVEEEGVTLGAKWWSRTGRMTSPATFQIKGEVIHRCMQPYSPASLGGILPPHWTN